MSKYFKILSTLALTIMALSQILPVSATTTSCKALRTKYEFGVAKTGAHNVGLPLLGKPKTASSVFQKYRSLDTDNDGIACELTRQLNQIERLETGSSRYDLEHDYYDESVTLAAAKMKASQLPMDLRLAEQFQDSRAITRITAELSAANQQIVLSNSKLSALDLAISNLPSYGTAFVLPDVLPRTSISCTQLRRAYPNGVSSSGYYTTGALQVGYPKLSTSQYSKFARLDTDRDGVSCEIHRNMSTKEKIRVAALRSSVAEQKIYSTTAIPALSVELEELRQDRQTMVYYGSSTEELAFQDEEIGYKERWKNAQVWLVNEFERLEAELPRS